MSILNGNLTGNSIEPILSPVISSILSPDLWTPSELTMGAWFDASNAASLPGAGAVDQWDDLSGNGNHATQGTGAYQPQTGSETINGLNVLDFDGSNDRLEVSGLGTGEDFTMFIVWKQEVEAVVAVSLFLGETSANAGFGLGWNNGRYNDFVWAADELSQTSQPVNTTRLQMGTHNSSGEFYLYMGGTEIGPSTGSSLNITYGTLTIGQARGWDAFTVTGQIAEVVFMPSVIGVSDRQKLEGYLAHKWGTEGLLASDHPYKASPPTL